MQPWPLEKNAALGVKEGNRDKWESGGLFLERGRFFFFFFIVSVANEIWRIS